MTPEILLEALDEGGYRREDPVTAPGQIARRGGILDVFPPDRDAPVRIEFFGDTIESLRTLRSRDPAHAGDPRELERPAPLRRLRRPRSVLGAPARARCRERFADARELAALPRAPRPRPRRPRSSPELLPLVPGRHRPALGASAGPWSWSSSTRRRSRPRPTPTTSARARGRARRREDPLALGRRGGPRRREPRSRSASQRAPAFHLREVDPEARGLHLACPPRAPLRGRPARPRRATSESAAGRDRALPRQPRPRRPPARRAARGRPRRRATGRAGRGPGGRALRRVRAARRRACASSPTATSSRRRCTSTARPPRRRPQLPLRLPRPARSATSSSTRTTASAASRASRRSRSAGLRREFMVLVYQGGDKLKVPGRRLRPRPEVRERRRARAPPSTGWAAATGRRSRSASRRPCATWPRSCSSSTPSARRVPATPSPARAPGSASSRRPSSTRRRRTRPRPSPTSRADMARDAPMDRLICGDVGYGKTEVAMRAAMRAVLDGKQVAVLAPTTILAFQHWKTFRKRFAPVPGDGRDGLALPHARRRSRPSSRRSRRARSTSSSAPIACSRKDVRLPATSASLIVDEEQRFGVAAKERLKQLRTTRRLPDPLRHAHPAHAADGPRRASATCRSSRPRPRTAWPSRPRS